MTCLNFAPIRQRLEVRSGEVRLRGGDESTALTFTPPQPTPLLYVACLFTNHIMQNNGPSSMSVWMLASLSFAMVVYLYTVLYGLCLRYLSELPTVFYQLRLTLFHFDDFNWLFNILCYCLYFPLLCFYQRFSLTNILIMILMCRVLTVLPTNLYSYL